MNNKGFTLVELIGIILILAAIFLISFPALLNLFKSDEEKAYNNMIKDLCLAGETFIYLNYSNNSGKNDFDLSIIGNKIDINIEELISYGSVDSELKNPKTDNSVSDDVLEYTVQSDNSLDCIYIDN